MLAPTLLFAVLLAAKPAVPAQAIAADVVVPFDGTASTAEGLPPGAALTLRAAVPGGPSGRVWFTTSDRGLVVTGAVDGPAPAFAPAGADVATLLAADHVEVWLAGPNDAQLPPLGWGNQFGEQGPDACDERDVCRAWADRQRPHRAAVAKQLVRQWVASGGAAVEAYATPARGALLDPFAAFAPRGGVRMKAVAAAGARGWTFQVEVPWTALPPLDVLEVAELRVLVDVFARAPAGARQGAFASTSAARRWGVPATFNRVRLARPRVYRVSPCDDPLGGADVYGKEHRAWYVPEERDFQSSFLIVNSAVGYQYEPSEPSPILQPIPRFWREVEPGTTLCGPELSIRRGDGVHRLKLPVRAQGLALRRLPGGAMLVKSGPEVREASYFGSGTCGSCPRALFDVIHVDRAFRATRAFAIELVHPGSEEQDLALAPDWSRVTLFRREAPEALHGPQPPWTAEDHCLRGTRYVACGVRTGARPPDPPNVPELREPGEE